MMTYPYRVTGDSVHIVYSQHRSLARAERAAKRLARKWGWSHPGTGPVVQRLTVSGWHSIAEYPTADQRHSLVATVGQMPDEE